MTDLTALAGLVGDPRTFLRKYWGTRILHRRAQGRAAFDDVLCMDDVDRLISSTQPHYPDVNLVQDGMQIDPGEFSHPPDPRRGGARVIDAARVYEYFHAGATIQMQGIHFRHAPLAVLCRRLELELTVPVQANLYVTPPEARGLGLHTDSHDVLVLQVAGTKHWKVYDRLPAGTDLDHLGAPPRLRLETDLQTGDVLYVPRGVPHQVASTTQTSAHLTIGFVPPSWGEVLRDLVADLLDEMAETPAFRTPLPARFAREHGRFASALSTRLRALAERLDEVDPREAAAVVSERFWAERSPVLEGQLGQLVELSTVRRNSVLVRRPASIAELTEADDALVLVLGDRSLKMPATLRPAMNFILGRASFKVSDLNPYLDHESQLVLARRLVREGLLMHRSCHPATIIDRPARAGP